MTSSMVQKTVIPDQVVVGDDVSAIATAPTCMLKSGAWHTLVVCARPVCLGDAPRVDTPSMYQVDLGRCAHIAPRHLQLTHNSMTGSWEVRCLGLAGLYVNGKYYSPYHVSIVLKDMDELRLETLCTSASCRAIHSFYVLLPTAASTTTAAGAVVTTSALTTAINNNGGGGDVAAAAAVKSEPPPSSSSASSPSSAVPLEWQVSEIQSVIDGLMTFGYARMAEIYVRLILQPRRTSADVQVMITWLLGRMIRQCRTNTECVFVRRLYCSANVGSGVPCIAASLVGDLDQQLSETTTEWVGRLMNLHMLCELCRLAYSECTDVIEMVPPGVRAVARPCAWWTDADDRTMLWGVYLHGWSQWSVMFSDPALAFTRPSIDPHFITAAAFEQRLCHLLQGTLLCRQRAQRRNGENGDAVDDNGGDGDGGDNDGGGGVPLSAPLVRQLARRGTPFKHEDVLLVVRCLANLGITPGFCDDFARILHRKHTVTVHDLLLLLIVEMETVAAQLDDSHDAVDAPIAGFMRAESALGLTGLAEWSRTRPVPLLAASVAQFVRERIIFFHMLRFQVLQHPDFETMTHDVASGVCADLHVPEWWRTGVHDCALLRAFDKYGCDEWPMMMDDEQFATVLPNDVTIEPAMRGSLLRRAYKIVKELMKGITDPRRVYYEAAMKPHVTLPRWPLHVYHGMHCWHFHACTQQQYTVQVPATEPLIDTHTDSRPTERLVTDADGAIVLPMPLSHGFTLYRLGRICANSVSSITRATLYPLEYVCVTRHQSWVHPLALAHYKCEVASDDAGVTIVFRVTCEDEPTRTFVGATPHDAWQLVANSIVIKSQEIDKLRVAATTAAAATAVASPVVDGDERFGLTHPVVVSLLQQQLAQLGCDPYPYVVQSVRVQHVAIVVQAHTPPPSSSSSSEITDVRTIIPSDIINRPPPPPPPPPSE